MKNQTPLLLGMAALLSLALYSCGKDDDNDDLNPDAQLGEMYFKALIGTDSVHYTDGRIGFPGQSSGVTGCDGVVKNLSLLFFDAEADKKTISMETSNCYAENVEFCTVHEWLYEVADYNCVVNPGFPNRSMRFTYEPADNTVGNNGVYRATGMVRVTDLEEIAGNRIISGTMTGILSPILGSAPSKQIGAIFRVKVGEACQ